MSWKDFQIRTKVLLIGIIFISLSIAMGVSWIYDLKQSNIAVKTLFEDRVTALVNLSTLTESALKIRSIELRASNSFNEDVVRRIEGEASSLASSMEDIWSAYSGRNLSDEERTIADDFESVWKVYLKEAKKTYILALDGLEDDAVVNVKSKSGATFNDALFFLERIVDLQRKDSQEIFTASQKNYAFSVKKSSAIIILGIGLTLACLIALYMSLVTPIRKVIKLLKNIAQGEGDLKARLNVPSKDEVGELAYWFNQFVDKLHGIMKGVAKSSEKMVRETESLKSISTAMTKGVGKQASSTKSIAASIEEMSVSIAQVAAGSSDVSEIVNESVKVVSVGNDVVEESLVGMEKISSETQKSSTIVERLGQNSASIDNIVLVIEDIADQTNLLALNAAIEAARAGEHGRGFAVVSDEVRKLAEKTIKATKEISQVISNIHTDTSAAVKSMDSGKKEVEHGVALTNKSGTALQNILKIVNNVQEQIAQIASAMDEQSATADSISKEIEGITIEAGVVTKEVESVNKAIENLAEVSQELKSGVAAFNL